MTRLAGIMGWPVAHSRSPVMHGFWLDETGIDADLYLFRDRSRDAVLPWDIIDGGMKAPFFHSEYDKSLREEWTLPPKRAQENVRLLPVIS